MRSKRNSLSEEIIVIGAGGHARVIVALLQSLGRYRIRGILDLGDPRPGETILGIPIVGKADAAEDWRRKDIPNAALAIGDNSHRREWQKRLQTTGFALPVLVHPTAIVDSSVKLEEGVVICAGTIIGACANIQAGGLVNTGAIIDHECMLFPFVHIAPGCFIAGRVEIGQETFVGIGSCIIDRLVIGERVSIGAGSVVVSNIPDNTTAYGVPAKIKTT